MYYILYRIYIYSNMALYHILYSSIQHYIRNTARHWYRYTCNTVHYYLLHYYIYNNTTVCVWKLLRVQLRSPYHQKTFFDTDVTYTSGGDHFAIHVFNHYIVHLRLIPFINFISIKIKKVPGSGEGQDGGKGQKSSSPAPHHCSSHGCEHEQPLPLHNLLGRAVPTHRLSKISPREGNREGQKQGARKHERTSGAQEIQ